MNAANIRDNASWYFAACIAMCFAGGFNTAHAWQPAGEVILSRYTTQAAMPDANDENPLTVIAHVRFPRSETKTVGDAVRYLLLRTGYSLVDSDQLDPIVSAILARPLPESHRKLGAYSVEAMLKVLIGSSFELHVNPLNRTISYSPIKAAANERGAQR